MLDCKIDLLLFLLLTGP